MKEKEVSKLKVKIPLVFTFRGLETEDRVKCESDKFLFNNS